jgi:hypothetical protein
MIEIIREYLPTRVEAQSNAAGGGTAAYDDDIILVKVLSDGSYTKQTLTSYVCSGSFNQCVGGVPYWTLGEVIPDGLGGVLASYSHCDSNCPSQNSWVGGVFHVNSGGVAPEFVYQFPTCPNNMIGASVCALPSVLHCLSVLARWTWKGLWQSTVLEITSRSGNEQHSSTLRTGITRRWQGGRSCSSGNAIRNLSLAGVRVT